MAQKITVAVEDDLDGGPADETVRFGIGGTEYQIDLSAANAAAFRQKLAPFTEHARTTGRSQPGRARTPAGRHHGEDIRAWAKGQGITISDRGRIPASIAAQYHAATGRT
jgi:Lsr2